MGNTRKSDVPPKNGEYKINAAGFLCRYSETFGRWLMVCELSVAQQIKVSEVNRLIYSLEH